MRIDNFNDIFGSVGKKKIEELKDKIKKLGIDLFDIDEKFQKGSGNGGQKINKTNNAVLLRYRPLGISVRCQRERSLSINRFIALRDLVERIEDFYLKNPDVIIKKKRGIMILEGKTLSEQINAETKLMAEDFLLKKGRKPFLAIINYFENSPSSYYMNLKIKKSQKLGIDTRLYMPREKTDKKFFISLIKELGNDKNVDAIMVEKPLPDGFDDPEFWDALNPSKDVDALSSINMGRLFISKKFDDIKKYDFFVPQTAYATIRLMMHYDIDISGKKITVVGRSSITGKPVAHMLSMLDGTVTICHTKTKNLNEYLKNSDIIVSAIGKANFIKSDMIGENQVLIDIGTNIDENGRMCGDIDFSSVRDIASAITPVPGGIGPVTLACLLNATVKAAKNLL
ncbi:MAG: bifunctional methylenetetrahydrofolate dehydrogenase/methenyltetrahydrofolate cyclohydrolase [Elusimicrobia bacterium]|nr:bifunctional methylenetetrahydrofolate dehydrogenase/methenyltetrahydrofolate cyclohydrolase [Elusimicrobiota bacterium]